MYENFQGFINSPKTTAENKTFYSDSLQKAHELLAKAESFLQEKQDYEYKAIKPSREEWAIQAKHLHRGFYCPSPVLDIIMSNAKRGKLLSRINSKSCVTHHYVYDITGKLLYTENFYSGQLCSTEYLIYKDNAIYGITVDKDRIPCEVSEEIYVDNHIRSYSFGLISYFSPNYPCRSMDCEVYHYGRDGLVSCDRYNIGFANDGFIKVEGYIKHSRYNFTQKDGYLSTFMRVVDFGKPVSNPTEQEIRLRRKA